MADGYTRASGKTGMFLVVPGPGLLNAGAALSTAYACSSPVLCVTGQIQSDLIGVGRGALHEIKDQMKTIASVTKWQGRAMRPAEIPAGQHQGLPLPPGWRRPPGPGCEGPRLPPGPGGGNPFLPARPPRHRPQPRPRTER